MDSTFHLFEVIKRKAPEFLDLITADTDAEFDCAFEAVLDKCIRRLEADAKNLQELNEDGLSAFIANGLSIPGLAVTREATTKGHVDITIVAEFTMPLRKKLAEAKIWDGPEYHIDGLRQLLERYSTGRECRGLVIAYVKAKGIRDLINKLRDRMNEVRPCAQAGDVQPHTFRWSLLSAHAHSSGETLEVCHVGCNLHV